MKNEELNKILEEHIRWLNEESGGEVADLSGAHLRGVDLSGANLRCANLRCANLVDADLVDADLSGVDLSGADLSGANLSWSVTEDMQGQTVFSVQVNTTRKNNRISYWKELDVWTTGCFQGTLEKLKEAVAETHENNEFMRKRYERAIDFILNEVEKEMEGNILKAAIKELSDE